jgi:DNA-directed RNA polymerase specialized sigma24 family protein
MPSSPADPAIESVANAEYDDFVKLVPRIKEGEQQAMEELYAFLKKGLGGALRTLGEQKVDHLHDTFLDVVEAIRKDTLRDPARVMGFATVIGRRNAWHTMKVWNCERTTEADLGDLQPRETRQSTEEMLLAEEHQLIAKRALAELPSAAREILERFYILGQSKEQICREMGLTETQFPLG